MYLRHEISDFFFECFELTIFVNMAVSPGERWW